MSEPKKITNHLKAQVRVWIEALRSGKYEQAQEALQTTDGFCCLGVACDVFIPKSKLKLEDGLSIMDGGEPTDQPNAPDWLRAIDSDFSARTGMSLMGLNDDGIEYEVEYADEDDRDDLQSDDAYVGLALDSHGNHTRKAVKFKEPLTFDEIADLLQLVYLEEADTSVVK